MTVPLRLEDYRVLLLDMNSTFMFGEDRFGPGEDFGATYQELGGRELAADEVERTIRAAFRYLEVRYQDSAYEDDFPSLHEAFAAVAPRLPVTELKLLGEIFSHHERGTVPPAYAEGLRALSATHELRLLSNIWAPRDAWVAELDRARVLPLFDRVVFSSDTRSVKPSLRLTVAALDGVTCERREVLIVGDSLQRDVAAGRRAGLRTAWITSGRSVPADADGEPDYLLTSLLELVALTPPPTSASLRRGTA